MFGKKKEQKYFIEVAIAHNIINFDECKEYENLTMEQAKKQLKVVKQKIEAGVVELFPGDEDGIINWNTVSSAFIYEQ